MVGTYHRAGVSQLLVRPLKPLVELVGRRLDVRVAVSDAARRPGDSPAAAISRCSSTGSTWTVTSRRPPCTTTMSRAGPRSLFIGRHEQRKGLGVLLDAFEMVDRPAVLWVAGEGPSTEVLRRRHPASDRVRVARCR